MLTPVVRRGYGPRARTPILDAWDRRDRISAVSAITVSPGNHRLGMMSMLSADNANITARDIVSFLKQIRRNISGPLLIVWDKGTVHDRSKDVRDYLAKHPEIHTEKFPSYAPELNPVELIWSTTKYGRMANFTPVNTNQLRSRLCEEMARLRNRKDLLASFIQHALPDLRLWG